MEEEKVIEKPAEPEIASEEVKEEEPPKAKPSAGKKKRKKKTAGQLAAAFFIKLAVTFAVLWIVFNYVAAIYVNHKHSSYPMIKDGDLCLVYRLGKLEEGAEVAYEKNGEICFGRIAAKAGDTVDIRGDVLTVNGMNVLEEVVYPTTAEGSTIEYPYTVPADSYFILNDYRAEVTDSRAGGAIKKDSIKGRIIFIMRRRGI